MFRNGAGCFPFIFKRYVYGPDWELKPGKLISSDSESRREDHLCTKRQTPVLSCEAGVAGSRVPGHRGIRGVGRGPVDIARGVHLRMVREPGAGHCRCSADHDHPDR